MSDDLDACSESFDLAEKNTLDCEVDVLILFADVDWTDAAAVEKRAVEWRELFA